jgi:hypothetical protein
VEKDRTVISCIAISDVVVPPLLVFPRKTLELPDGGPHPPKKLVYATLEGGRNLKFSLNGSQISL